MSCGQVWFSPINSFSSSAENRSVQFPVEYSGFIASRSDRCITSGDINITVEANRKIHKNDWFATHLVVTAAGRFASAGGDEDSIVTNQAQITMSPT